jgi:menaquinone-dependent protoporphyrinogen oxidase
VLKEIEMTEVMVVAASRHGATRGIADRIAATLRAEGIEASVYDAKEAPSPGWADAVIIGGAAYMGKWLTEATDYVRNHHAALSERPTWLFASGPVGPDAVDKAGRDVLTPPAFLNEAAADVLAQGTRVFFGRWDPADPPMSLAERLFKLLPVSTEVLPVGDFRDWQSIEAWAQEIARVLKADLGRELIATG